MVCSYDLPVTSAGICSAGILWLARTCCWNVAIIMSEEPVLGFCYRRLTFVPQGWVRQKYFSLQRYNANRLLRNKT